MAKDTAVVEVDYSLMTYDKLMVEVGKAWEAKDMKLMGQLSRLATKAEVEVEKAKKEALLKELVDKTLHVKDRITAVIDEMYESGELDGAEGVWYVRDYNEKEEVGINPACRLVKTGKKASTGEGTGKSSYTSGLPPSEEMLKQIGDTVYLAEDTAVTINKVEEVLPAGTTYAEAYKHSTNGGWRNRVRMAMGREMKLI